MFKKFRFLFFPFLALVMFISSCTDDDTDDTTRTIKIGVLVPLAGEGSSTGESVNAALETALVDINNYLADVKSGCQVQLVVGDTESDSLTTIQRYTDLKDQGIRCIIGPCISANVAAVRDLAGQDDMLIISPASVASSLSLPDDNVFRLVPDMAGQGEAMTALLNDDGIEVILPVVRDDLWGHDLLQATSQQFLLSRKTVAEAITYPVSTSDFSPVITSLTEKLDQLLETYAPEKTGIYMLSYNEGTAIMHLASATASLGTVRWYGSSAYAENKTLPPDWDAAAFAQNTQLTNPAFGYDPASSDKWEPLLAMLEAELGRKPEIYALAAYDALWLATYSYLSAGVDANVATLKKALNTQAGMYFGATGRTTLNANGDRAFSTYDFWGIHWITNDWLWAIVARYNNATGELVRY